jgi:hypothetical protein
MGSCQVLRLACKGDVILAPGNLGPPSSILHRLGGGPPHACVLRYSELIGASLCIYHCDAGVPGVSVDTGRRQGVKETPVVWLWPCALDHVLGPTAAFLEDRGLSADVGDG